MRLSRRITNISPSPTMAISGKAKEMKSQGLDVVDFGAGEPDFDTPDHIKEAAYKAIREGYTKYTPVAGAMDIRKAVCEKLRRDNGLDYRPEEVLVSNGAKQSLYNAFMALCEEGDEVIIPAPYWVTYPEQVKLAGGVPVFVNTDPAKGFQLDPEAVADAVTPKTKIILINSPNNPTGAVYPKETLRRIAELAVEHDLYVLSDEVYERLIYGEDEHVSIASFGPEIKNLTVTINAVSKTYAMPGWRIGYSASPIEITKAMSALQSHSTSNAGSISQRAAIEALTGDQSAVDEMVVEFAARRDYMVGRLQRMPGISCPVPSGAFYVFPVVGEFFGRQYEGRTIVTSDDLAEVILEKGRVAVVPGTGFGYPDNIRLSYATSMEVIREGLDRIEEVLSKLA